MSEPMNIADALEVEAKRIFQSVGLDSIQIIATYTDSDGDTVRSVAGHGNWYARVGSCREFVLRDEERNREDIRREVRGEEGG